MDSEPEHVELLSIRNLPEVTSATFDARNKWYFIGLELGIDDNTLKTIRERFRDDPDQCHNEMLSYRLQQNNAIEWIDLVKTLQSRSVGFSRLAATIAKNHDCPLPLLPPAPIFNHRELPPQANDIECYKAPIWKRFIAWSIDVILLMFTVRILPGRKWSFVRLMQLDGPMMMTRVIDPYDMDVESMDFLTVVKFIAGLVVIEIILESTLLAMFSTSVGKWVMGVWVWTCVSPPRLTDTVPGYTIRVERGDKISFITALIRTTYKSVVKQIVTAPLLGLLHICLKDRMGRSHYDRVAKTIVVCKKTL